MNTYPTELPDNLLTHEQLTALANEYLDRKHQDGDPSYTGASLISDCMRRGDGDMLDDNIVVKWGNPPYEYCDFCEKIIEYDRQTYDEEGEIDSYELLGFMII